MRRKPRGGYDAFISYSHKADGDLAPILQRSLHGFARSWYRRRAMRVFRDIASLSATAGLMSAIEGVLRQTRFLILLASPAAAKSPWVPREVGFWCEHKSSKTLLIALTEGDAKWSTATGDFDWEKTTALPPILSGKFAEEPLLVDLRWAKETEKLGPRHPGLREATATLAAAIHGRDRDLLIGDDIRRHRRAIQVAVLAAVLIVGFAGVATWQYDSARKERDNAVEQAQQARSLALSASSGLQLADHPKTALLLGLEAYKLRPRAEARSALVAALQVAAQTGAGPILRGHTDIARAAAFSPDGKTLVSVGDDRVVRLWDTRTRRELEASPLRGHDDLVMAVDVSPDGRVVASGSWDGTVRLWEMRGDGAAGEVLRDGDRVQAVAFGPRLKLLAVASGPGVEIWRYRDGENLGTLPAGDDVEDVAFSPNGALVAGATGSGDAFIWDLSAGDAWSVHHGGIAGAVAFSPDGRTLAVGGTDESTKLRGTVSLWDVDSRGMDGKPVRTHTDLIRGVAWTHDGGTLFAAGQDGSVARLDARRRRLIDHLPDVSEESGVWGLTISRDGRTLAIPASDGTVRMWHVVPPGFGSPLTGAAGDVTGIAVSPHGALVAAAHDRGSIDLWDAARGELLHTLEQPPKSLWAVAFDPSGEKVVFSSRGQIRIWDPDSGDVTAMRGRIPAILSLAVSRDGKMVASGEFDGQVRLWDVRTRRQIGPPIETPDSNPRSVEFVAFSPDGAKIAFAVGDFTDQEIRLVDVDSREVEASTGGIWPLDSGVVLPEGTVRAASIKYPHITLVTVDPTTTRRIRVGTASAAALSPEGGTLLVGGEKGGVRAWDADALQPLGAPFGGDSSGVSALAFSADGETFAAGGENGSVRVWRGVFWNGVGEIEKRVCRDAGSSLSRDDWDLVAPGIPYSASCG